MSGSEPKGKVKRCKKVNHTMDPDDERSQTALGSYYRRMKTRLGAAEAVTAMAHKLARLVYRLIKFGENYVRQGMEDYERKFQERKLAALQKTAKTMGFSLVANQQVSCPVS